MGVAVVAALVTASSGRTCSLALHVASDTPVPLLLSIGGSGLYAATAAEVPEWYSGRVEQGELAYLVFDKPGVRGVAADGEVALDPAVFAAYTPQDLLDCADAALTWASARDDVRDDGHVVVGHSEGALVAASLAEAAVAAGRPDRFRTVVLSGFPIEGLKAAVAYQARRPPERELARFQREEARDLAGALRDGPGMGAATMEAWWARGDAHHAADAVVAAKIPLLVQHGVDDAAVPVAWIDAWASAQDAPWVVVQLFDAGHNGNREMIVSQVVWVDHLLGLDVATGFLARARSGAE